MLIEQEIIDRIENINWFVNCGTPIHNSNIEVVYELNWRKAARHSLGRYWDEITNEAKNDLTEYLCLNFPEKYKKWNKYTNEGREIIEQIVVPKVKDYLIKHEVTLDILNTVKWDILIGIMEYTYRIEREPKFYMNLLQVYESGNFPCGWKGSWPNGKLIVY